MQPYINGTALLPLIALLCGQLCCLASAQEVVLRESAPGVEVGSVGWTLPDNRRNLDASPGPLASAETRLSLSQITGEGEASPSTPPIPAANTRRALFVRFKNRTSIPVREFWWEVILKDTAINQSRYEKLWHSRVRLASGEEELVVKEAPLGKEWAGVNINSVGEKRRVIVRVVRVKYGDGTEWRRR